MTALLLWKYQFILWSLLLNILFSGMPLDVPERIMNIRLDPMNYDSHGIHFVWWQLSILSTTFVIECSHWSATLFSWANSWQFTWWAVPLQKCPSVFRDDLREWLLQPSVKRLHSFVPCFPYFLVQRVHQILWRMLNTVLVHWLLRTQLVFPPREYRHLFDVETRLSWREAE